MNKVKALVGSATLVVASVLNIFMFSGVVKAATDTCTWTGGGADDNFSTAANWTGCDNGNVPEDGDSLIFGVADATPVNDLGLLVVSTLTFNTATTISGDDIGIETVVVNADSKIQANVVIAGAATVSGSSDLELGMDDVDVLDFLSSAASLTATNPLLRIYSTISGDGTLIQNNALSSIFISADSLGFNGNIEVQAGTLWAQNLNALGSATGATIVSDNARVLYYFTSDQGTSPTISEPFTLGAPDSSTFSNYTLGVQSTVEQMFTFSGDITLTANTKVRPSAKNDMKLTGALNGAYTIGVGDAMEGSLILAASPNNSQTPNGTYTTTPKTTEYTGDQPSDPVSVYYMQTAVVTGTRGTANVASGGTIKGTGTLGSVVVADGATIAPGMSPGCLTTGNLTENGVFATEIGGTTACTGYDQLVVNGTVTLGATASLTVTRYGGFTPAVGNTFTIINNDSNDAVTGTFTGMAEGATFTQDGVTYRINYAAGDGNDVVLTVTAVPTTPNTGVAQATKSFVWIMAISMVALAGSFALARRRDSNR